MYGEHVINNNKISNKTHTGDVTDNNGELTVTKIKGVDLSSFSNNSVLKVTTGGVIAAATAADYPTLNQSTNGNALTATTATKSTNLVGGATGSLPYQAANDSTQMLSAGVSGTVLKSNGAAAPSWSAVEKSMLSTTLANEITASTNKTGNLTHSGDVTDAGGVLTVTKLNGTPLESFNATTATSATTAATATKSTNLVGGTTGSIPYQTTVDSTLMLGAGASGTVLKSNGAAAPSWSAVEKSMLSTTLANEITASTNKTGNLTHSGDVTDTGGVLKVTGINNVSLSTLGTGILKNTTGTGVPSIATAADFPTSTVSTGGTGITSYSVGDLLYASTNTTLDKLTSIAAGNVLTTNGTNNAPSYGKVALSGAVTHITGTLPVSSGGTGATSLTGYVKGSGTGNLTANANVPVTDLSGTLPVSQGGTGAVTLTGYVKGNGTGNFTANANVPVADIGGTLLVTQGGTGATTSTGTGSVVLATSPSLTTPNLGIPAIGVLSNCVGLPIGAGTTGTLPVDRGGTGNTSFNGYVRGTGTGSLSAVGSIPTTDLSGSIGVANGGTGQSTFASGILRTIGGTNGFQTITQPDGDLVGTTATQTLTNKTLTAPDLGTPISGVLTNCTGLSLTTGVTGILPIEYGGTGTTTGGGGSGVVDFSSPSNTGILPVSKGGTGSTSPNGYFFGDGTGGGTFSATIPASRITDLPTGGGTDLASATGVLAIDKGGTGSTSPNGYFKGDGAGGGSFSNTIPASAITGTVASVDFSSIDNIGTLPANRGGTGFNQSCYGELSKFSETLTAGSSTAIKTLNINPSSSEYVIPNMSGYVTGNSLSNFITVAHASSNSTFLRYTGTATRRFILNASVTFKTNAILNDKIVFGLGTYGQAYVTSNGDANHVYSVSMTCIQELTKDQDILFRMKAPFATTGVIPLNASTTPITVSVILANVNAVPVN